MLTVREKQVVFAGVLLGLAAGLTCSLVILAVLLNHMFVLGVRWSASGLYLAPSLLLAMIVTGVVLLRSRRYR